MKKTLLLALLLPLISLAQLHTHTNSNKFTTLAPDYSDYFHEAYQLYPSIPQGVLEAVAYGNTHIYHITHTPDEMGSCTGLPFVYGIMGLTLNGKGYFSNNLVYVSNLSGISTDEIITNPEKNILAYAGAFNSIMSSLSSQQTDENKPGDLLLNTLTSLSELPHETDAQNFALNQQLYSYFWFLNNHEFQAKYNFPDHGFDLQTLFGEENYRVLSSDQVVVSQEAITDENGNVYKSTGNNNQFTQSSDYSAALWNAAASCNYSSRTQAITAVVIHDIEGSYASCISWFQNCNANVSAHYVVRSSDGQITQMVLESKKAWHVGSENGYTIGIEHEGFQAQTGWYTNAMYQSSANLVKDICTSGYGINPTTCWNGASCSGSCVKPSSVKIKGHQMYPNQTHDDPGPNWNWTTYYNLINNTSQGCGTPSSLVANSITSTSATLNWSAVPSAISYNITYTSSSGPVNTTSNTNSISISGLTPATAYQFKVQAVCTQPGVFSSLSSFTTSPTTSSNSTLTIGTSTTPYSAHPYGTVYMDERVQYIYSKTELVSTGWTASSPYLKSLSFYVSSAAPQSLGSFTISISHISSSAFSGHTFLSGTNNTVVYSGTVTATQGWNTYTFTTPFNYNGTSNLLINICWNNSNFTVNSSVHATSYSSFVALYRRVDVSNGGICNTTSSATLSYYRPNTKLEFSSTSTFSMPQGQEQRSLQLGGTDTEQTNVELFPNPIDGGILYGKLEDASNQKITLKMYDMLGREVISREVISEGGNFSVSLAGENLKTGVYTLVGVTDTNRFVKRVVTK